MKKHVVSAVATAAILSGTYATAASASTYTVQKGDTLSSIANKFKTSVPDLKKLNKLSSDFLQINQVLKISEDLAPPATKPAAAPKPAAPKPTAVTPVAPVATPVAKQKVYTVANGDSLSKIAFANKVAIADLIKWNGLSSTIIFPGDRLFISAPAVATPKPAPAPTTTPAPVPAPAPSTTPTTVPATVLTDYIIKNGDTLGSIALKFSCSVSDLKKQNGLKNDRIYVGQKLKVAVANVVVKTPTPSETPAPDQTNSPGDSANTLKEYVVQDGDTLGLIAAQFGMTIDDVKTLNNMSSDLIFAGQKMKVNGEAVPTSAKPNFAVLASAVIREAKALMGVPYVWGGSTNTGFDCSGFVYYVFNKAGLATSRYNAAGFYNRSYYVDTPQPGDLVFFENTYKPGISHVGIYLGDNQFIHADENRGIAITSLSNSYFQAHFDGFKRFY